jgi:hypothetical protein
MKKVLAMAVLTVFSMSIAAQEKSGGGNPVSDSVRGALTGRAKNMTAAAEAMPADKYGFKPTPEQMTFAHLIVHTIESNNTLCSKLANQAQPPTSITDKDPKDKLVSELKNSFSYCETALKGVQDAQLGEEVTLFGGRKGPKAQAILGLVGGWADHYGAAAIYLRLNGVLPPSAQPAPKPEEKK